jgi:hypothetical protein
VHGSVAAVQLLRSMTDKFLHRPADLDPLAHALPSLDDALSRRVNADLRTSNEAWLSWC